MYNVAGTHSGKDLITDAYLAVGSLKSTSRYRSADDTLKKAKAKYGVENATITGHSLGGQIINGIAKKGDKSYALDAGYTLFQPTRSRGGDAKNYRTSGDLVSGLAGSSNVKTLKNPNLIKGGLIGGYLAHNVDNIKNEKIYV